jgi:hypothetical protein
LNESQIQDRFEKAMDDTYGKDAKPEKEEAASSETESTESFAEVFKTVMNPSHPNEQHASPNVIQNGGDKPIYPAKDSHSEILPYNQRDHAFNDEQYTNSSEKTWNESTQNGMPLSGTYA